MVIAAGYKIFSVSAEIQRCNFITVPFLNDRFYIVGLAMA
jgi:hypothetical protein